MIPLTIIIAITVGMLILQLTGTLIPAIEYILIGLVLVLCMPFALVYILTKAEDIGWEMGREEAKREWKSEVKTKGEAMKVLLVAITIVMALQVSAFAQDCTIVKVPEQEIQEELGEDIIKYDVTTYKKIKDIKGVEFVAVDKTERIDIHQLKYDNAQAQAEIDRMTLRIPELQDSIVKGNEMIEKIKGVMPKKLQINEPK